MREIHYLAVCFAVVLALVSGCGENKEKASAPSAPVAQEIAPAEEQAEQSASVQEGEVSTEQQAAEEAAPGEPQEAATEGVPAEPGK